MNKWKLDIKQILAFIFTPGIISALLLGVAGNEKGLHYTAPKYVNDGIRIKLFKVGNFDSQKANEYEFLFSSTSEELKFEDVSIERQSMFGTDQELQLVNIEEQNEIKRKVKAQLQNGYYHLMIQANVPKSVKRNKPLRYLILQKNVGYKHLQPRQIDFFRNLLFLMYFYAMEIISLTILIAAIITIIYYRNRNDNENTDHGTSNNTDSAHPVTA